MTDSSYGKRSISTFGGAMLIANSVAGPTIMLMPALVQEAGWLAVLLMEVIIASMSAGCGLILLSAMRSVPGNSRYELRVEYTDLMRHYLPDMSGCAYGIQLYPRIQMLCGSATNSSTPFGDNGFVFSASLLVVAVVCSPFAVRNLDDNIVLQILAVGGLAVLTIMWLIIFTMQDDFPSHVPVATWSQGKLIGTLLFNFAFMATLPSWANEKQPNVSAGSTFMIALSYVVLTYTAVGILGGMAWNPFFHTDATLFSKLNASGSGLARATVVAYPILQNFSSIPVFSILIRYNLMSSGHFNSRAATFCAVVLPWILSIPFYTGRGFADVAAIGGFVASSMCNFIAPVIVYYCSSSAPVNQATTYMSFTGEDPRGQTSLKSHDDMRSSNEQT